MTKFNLLFVIISLASRLSAQSVAEKNPERAFTIENVSFSNAGVTLAGAIFKPGRSHASIVLVHGSGQERRMFEMATLLANNGISVITYDKRGVGESGGIYQGPEVGTNNIDPQNLNLLASDASAAANALLLHLSAKHGPIGLMGFSQAGWIIPLAAEKNPKINFMVVFSGPVVSTLEQLRFQFYTKGNSRFWETHTEEQVLRHVLTDPDKYQFEPTNPVDALSNLSIPGLWIYGGKDIQVPVKISTQHLNKLKASGKLYQYQLFPELDHNTSSSKSAEPVNLALRWIKSNVLQNETKPAGKSKK